MAKTIREIASEIGVSKQAVFKKIKRQPLSTSLQGLTTTVDGKLMVSVDGEILIKQAFFYDAPSTTVNRLSSTVDDLVDGTSTDIQEKLKGVDSPFSPQSIHNASDNTVSERLIDMLQRELEIKNEQIRDLNARLAESNAAFVAAQQTAQAAQALHAGTMQKQLSEDEKHSEADKANFAKDHKHRWLSRILKK